MFLILLDLIFLMPLVPLDQLLSIVEFGILSTATKDNDQDLCG